MYYNCIDSGRDRSVTLTWADAPCVNCGLIVDTPTFDITPGNVVDTPTFDIVPVEGAVEPVTFPFATDSYMYFGGGNIPIDMECPTVGADIYYTVDGSDPTEASLLYSGRFPFYASTAYVKARAYKSGLTASAISTLTIAIANPYSVFTKLTDSSTFLLTYSELVADYCLAFASSIIGNPGIVSFDQLPDGSSHIRHVILDGHIPAPTGFFEDTGTVVPLTLLGSGDGFNLIDANGNPYASMAPMYARHYAVVAGDGSTYGFNVKLTF